MVEALCTVLSPGFLIYLVMGAALGMFVGAMPGISSPVAVIMVLPLTFYMRTENALGLLVSAYMATLCAGGITAVYFNIPGTPQAVITAIDGYPMAQKGKYCEAAGIVVGSSFLGGLISYTILSFCIKPLGELALKFGPLELFFTALLGMVCAAAAVTGKHPLRGLASGLMGFLLGTIGMSPTGEVRAIYGMIEWMEGIPWMPALIGMLAMSEVLRLLEKETVAVKRLQVLRNFRKVLSGFAYVFKKPIDVLFGSLIGTVVGIIPGEGATMASFLSHSRAKQMSHNPEKFGTGVPEGVIAAETADNASTGGGLLITLTLGIPGTGTCALLMAVLILHGVEPGPMMVVKHLGLMYTMLASLFVASVIMAIFAIVVAYYLGVLLFIPTKLLIPIIAIFCTLGTFMTHNSTLDVWLMYFFALLGWTMRKYHYSPLAFVVGLIVAPIADAELIRAIQIFGTGIFGAIASSIICIVLIGLNLLLLLTLSGLFRKYVAKRGTKSVE